MNMHSEDAIQRQGRRTVLGKRTRCSTVSSLGQPTFDRTPDSKSHRNSQPKVLQLGEGRSQQARNCHDSNADSTSETSSLASTSEAPALCATGDASESYGASSNTGLGHETASDRPDIPGDETSSLSSSSSNSDDSGSSILNSSDLNMGDHEDSGSASGSDEIIDLPTMSKPRIDRKQALRQGEQLRYRLAAFLPQMAAANSFLHTELEDGRKDKYHIEDVDESKEPYIEMDLGMGVLEEIRPEGDDKTIVALEKTGEQSSTSDDSQEDEDVIGNLTGQKRRKGTIDGIKEIS